MGDGAVMELWAAAPEAAAAASAATTSPVSIARGAMGVVEPQPPQVVRV